MRRLTRCIAVAATVATLTLGGAIAAHAQGLKDDPAPRRHSQPFTGLYVGGQVGWVGGDIDWTFTNGTNPANNPLDVDAGIFGGILGYQYQFGNIVLGVEGTYSGVLDGDDSSACPNAAFTCSTDLTSIATIGGRFGLAYNTAMIYFTGGYANAGVDTNTTQAGLADDDVGERLDGYYIGGGVDWMPVKNLVFGIEYRYYEFDAENFTSTRVAADNRSADLEANSVMARVTYLLK